MEKHTLILNLEPFDVTAGIIDINDQDKKKSTGVQTFSIGKELRALTKR